MKKNVWQMPVSSPYLRRSLEKDNNHLLVQVQRRSGLLWKRMVHKINGTIAEKMLLEFAESGCPIFRATTALEIRCCRRWEQRATPVSAYDQQKGLE